MIIYRWFWSPNDIFDLSEWKHVCWLVHRNEFLILVADQFAILGFCIIVVIIVFLKMRKFSVPRWIFWAYSQFITFNGYLVSFQYGVKKLALILLPIQSERYIQLQNNGSEVSVTRTGVQISIWVGDGGKVPLMIIIFMVVMWLFVSLYGYAAYMSWLRVRLWNTVKVVV